jgi:hypothetical protein
VDRLDLALIPASSVAAFALQFVAMLAAVGVTLLASAPIEVAAVGGAF